MTSGAGPGSGAVIWIDLDNTPHVPLFRPLIRALTDRGHRVWVTARDDRPLTRLVQLFDVRCDMVGRGRSRTLPGKALSVIGRAAQLAWATKARGRADRPVLAVNHGSRPQALAARALGIPALCMLDYEHVATGLLQRCCDTFLVPDRITDEDLRAAGIRGVDIQRYPGLKEHLYLADDAADRVLDAGRDVVVLYRPESPTAHYLSGVTDPSLEDAFLERLAAVPEVRLLLIAREEAQGTRIGAALDARGIRWEAPPPTDGRELIRRADLVVTGGGTMGREAVALGVPAASIFRGRWGAVDRELAREGRLLPIRTAADMAALPIVERDRSRAMASPPRTLERVLEVIEGMARSAAVA